jgi:hypothetical protein
LKAPEEPLKSTALQVKTCSFSVVLMT